MTIGSGMIVMTVVFGRILDADYGRWEKKVLGDAVGQMTKAEVEAKIPIEQVCVVVVGKGFRWC